MTEGENWIFQARKKLIESVMKEIDITKEPNEVYLKIFYAVSTLGLHMKARKAGLFERELWQQREKLEVVIKRIEDFLWREIK